MPLNEEKEKSFAELSTMFRSSMERYWRIALGPAAVIGLLTVVYALRLPDHFTSDFLIFIQPQAINSKILESPKQLEMRERLEAVVQEVIARRSLQKIIDQHDLYPNLRGRVGREIAVHLFRSDLNIEPAKSKTGVQVSQTFRISYKHSDPQLAHDVAKSLSDLFIEESIVSRRSEIQGTEEFLDGELTEARVKLEQTEKNVQEFVSTNFGKLPEHLTAAIARLENAQSQLSNNSTLIAANLARRVNRETEQKELQRQGFSLEGSRDVDSGDPVERLAQLESALVVLNSRYSAKHPDVIHTKERISSLKKQIATGSGSKRSSAASSSIRSSALTRGVRRELRELDVQLLSLRKENEQIKKTIAKLETDIQQMPIKEQELLKIKRDYKNVADNYDRLLQAREDASLQSSLVQSQRATQFKIIERAEVPIFPSGPKRFLYMIAGIICGILLFVLIPVTAYFFNGSYKFTPDIEEETGLPVIGVIPSMASPTSVVSQRRVNATCSVMSLLSFVGGGVAIMWFI